MYLRSHEETLDVRLGGIEGEVSKMDGVWGAGGEIHGSTGLEARLLPVTKSYIRVSRR